MHDPLPLVSVGIPTYNRESTVARAIESVLAQDYPNIELIISDNASTDGTQSICEKYAVSSPRVKYLRQRLNGGPTANFIEVFSRSSGTFFMWLADDDWLDPCYVSRCAEALQENQELVLVSGVARYHSHGTSVGTGTYMDLLYDSPLRRMLHYYASVSDNGTFYGVMRRDMAAHNPLRSCLGSDWLFVAGMAYQGKVKTVKTVSVYRTHGGASESIEQIVRLLSLSGFQAAFPYLSIATNALREILGRNPIYRSSSVARRSLFAIAVFIQLIISKAFMLNFRPVVSRMTQCAIGEERYRRLRNKIRSWMCE